jgi:hypothetical protein
MLPYGASRLLPRKGWLMKTKTYSRWFAVVVVALLAARVVQAEEPQEGKVLAIEKDSITILDKVEGDNDKYVIDAATKITRAGKPAKWSDIQVGDRVKITVGGGTKGKMVAKEISALPPE